MDEFGRQQDIVIGLNAVIVASHADMPRVLVVEEAGADALPFGSFQADHRTLESGLRDLVAAQTDLNLGYVEQLYTFGDRDRDPRLGHDGGRVISIGYLALVRDDDDGEAVSTISLKPGNRWKNWYDYFPWEDWRAGKPAILADIIEPYLFRWIDAAENPSIGELRRSRAAQTFATGASPWNEEAVLERYELLYEAGLIAESGRDERFGDVNGVNGTVPSRAMALDHRRILATGIGRLRSKIKYRPVVFELMPEAFTLLQLQRLVEGLAGKRLHKQNFRRLVETNGLVESAGTVAHDTGGRPAQQFRFRKDVVAERRSPGVKLPGSRIAQP